MDFTSMLPIAGTILLGMGIVMPIRDGRHGRKATIGGGGPVKAEFLLEDPKLEERDPTSHETAVERTRPSAGLTPALATTESRRPDDEDASLGTDRASERPAVRIVPLRDGRPPSAVDVRFADPKPASDTMSAALDLATNDIVVSEPRATSDLDASPSVIDALTGLLIPVGTSFHQLGDPQRDREVRHEAEASIVRPAAERDATPEIHQSRVREPVSTYHGATSTGERTESQTLATANVSTPATVEIDATGRAPDGESSEALTSGADERSSPHGMARGAPRMLSIFTTFKHMIATSKSRAVRTAPTPTPIATDDSAVATQLCDIGTIADARAEEAGPDRSFADIVHTLDEARSAASPADVQTNPIASQSPRDEARVGKTIEDAPLLPASDAMNLEPEPFVAGIPTSVIDHDEAPDVSHAISPLVRLAERDVSKVRGRAVPVTRLPLRPVVAAVTWTIDLEPPIADVGPERRLQILRDDLDRDFPTISQPALATAWREERGETRSLALRLLARRPASAAIDTFRDALRGGTEEERSLAIGAFAALGMPLEIEPALGDPVDAIVARASLATCATRDLADHRRLLLRHVEERRCEAVLGLLAGILQ